ncbi:MAG: hypothetical protein JXA15_03945 [Spirochaetales bacterium]|nr:hypothetical protein [Spirochaetales bacterium]
MTFRPIRGFAVLGIALLLLSSCGLFEGTSIEGKLKRLNRDAQSLIAQIQKEADPSRRKTLERDLAKVKDNIEDLLKDLAKESSKIDVKGMLDELGDGFEDIGDAFKDLGK